MTEVPAAQARNRCRRGRAPRAGLPKLFPRTSYPAAPNKSVVICICGNFFRILICNRLSHLASERQRIAGEPVFDPQLFPVPHIRGAFFLRPLGQAEELGIGDPSGL